MIYTRSMAKQKKVSDAPLVVRAPQDLMGSVKAKVAEDGINVSRVVHEIFVRYLAEVKRPPKSALPEKIRGDAVTTGLPLVAQEHLRRVFDEGESTGNRDVTNAYIRALADADWPWRSIAAALNISHTAAIARARTAERNDLKVSTPPVPKRTKYQRLDSAVGFARTSVRPDLGIYSEVLERADREGTKVNGLLVEGLQDYVDGKLKISD